MSIKDFLNNENNSVEKSKHPNPFKRGLSGGIDMIIVLMIRVMTIETLSYFWYHNQMIKFSQEFADKFGTQIAKRTPEHISYILHHSFFTSTLIFISLTILSGLAYYAYFNSSAWQATIGKRIMKIQMVRIDEKLINFQLATYHYILSILPFAYVLYLIVYVQRHQVTFFEAVTSSRINLFLGIIFLVWTQIQLFTRKKVTAYDLICKTLLINTRTSFKYPWSKNK